MTEHFTIHDDKYDVLLTIRNAKDYLDFLDYKKFLKEDDKNTLILMLDSEVEDVNIALIIIKELKEKHDQLFLTASTNNKPIYNESIK